MRLRGCEIYFSAVYISSPDIHNIFFVSPVYNMPVQDGGRSDKLPPPGAAAPQTGSSVLSSQAQAWGPCKKKRGAEAANWEWEKLMAEDPKIMDNAWSTFLSCAHLANKIP